MGGKVKLGSSDNQVFEVEEDVANESQTVKSLLEDSAGADDLIPLPNVSGKILSKVIEFCKYHVDAEKKGQDDKPSKSEEEVKVSRSCSSKRWERPHPGPSGFDLGRVTPVHTALLSASQKRRLAFALLRGRFTFRVQRPT